MSRDRMRELLLDSASRLFAEGYESDVHDRVDAGEWPAELWAAIEDNGLPAVLVPEERGGVGLTLSDAMAILRLSGAFAVAAPLAESMIGQWLLAAADLEPVQGPIAIALADGGIHGEDESAAALSRPLHGVPWLRSEAHLLVAGDEASGGSRLALFAIGEPATATSQNVAGEPRGSSAGGFEATAMARGVVASTSTERLRLLLALCRASQIAGAMDRILDLTLEHANGREQFGRPIGRFQAVQQQIAVLAGEVALVGAATDAAVSAWEQGGGEVLAAAAKARASEAAHGVAAIAHQVHAAIGFTREHDLHRFTRRLWAWRDEWGSETEWQEWIGRRAIAAGGDGLWPLLG
ncbi:MAG TPA: acyl-CoA dehydrogenase family protein [Thermoanaerobaculia bacterium]|nr:acyl-CoA dehydrogenase family protein [Thermoanaerobaculia bacterium]